MADITITASDVLTSANAQSNSGVAAVSITAGQTLYKLAAGTYGLANATGSTPVNSFAGVSLHAAATGQPINFVTNDPAFVFGGAATAGEVVYLSPNNAGGITGTFGDLSTGNTIIVLGVCITGGAAGTATLALAANPAFVTTHS